MTVQLPPLPQLIFVGAALLAPGFLFSAEDWRVSRLSSAKPDKEILRLDIDGDGHPDIIERWWNGKRVRWLDENEDMRADDSRGDQLADVLQIDIDGDGLYDGLKDINVKWADLNADGVPDMQAFIINPPYPPGQNTPWNEGEWMIFRNFDDRAVLGWMDWNTFDWDCWAYTGNSNWLPNYHSDTLFLKVHTSVRNLNDPTLNWENPFIFYDYDDDGVCDMAIRWVDSPDWSRRRGGKPDAYHLQGYLNVVAITYDLDGDSAKDNESDFDMSIRFTGRPGIDYRDMVQDVSGFVGNPKFDECFESNVWRRLDALRYMPPEDSYDAAFAHDWESAYFVFDEDDDDHRWERVEFYYPTYRQRGGPETIDIYSVERWDENGGPLGLSENRQSDSIGDRGEWDQDNSGQGRLYIGVFDRKLHLYGAEWGAWTVDKDAAYHGGWEAPPPSKDAPRVEEVVKYTDTDGNGFLDTIEYDYDGDRTVDLRVCLLDYATEEDPHPDVAKILDTRALGWQGLHEVFNKMATDAWVEAHSVYRAAWRRGLTTPEHDLLAFASSKAERYAEAYWLKEKLFRHFRSHLTQLAEQTPSQAESLSQLEADLIRLYYTGNFDAYLDRIGDIPTM